MIIVNFTLKRQLSSFNTLLKPITLGFLMLVFFQSALAQKPNPEWEMFRNGIKVQAMAEGHNSMWFGTSSGVMKINRKNKRITSFTIYNSQLPNDNVKAVVIDQSGNKWFGTGYGLAKFDGNNWEIFNESNSDLPDNEINSLAIDEDSDIIVGTEDGLAEYDRNNWFITNILADNVITSITLVKTGTRWIGTENEGLFLRSQGYTNYDTSNSNLPANHITSIAIDSSYHEWVGTVKNGMAKLTSSGWQVFNRSKSGLPNDRVTSIVTDTSGNKWIGTHGAGVTKYDGSQWQTFIQENSGFSDNNVLTLGVDSTNDIWTGSYRGFVERFSGQNWSIYREGELGIPGYFSNFTIDDLTIDDSGNKWVITEEELAKFNDTSWYIYNRNLTEMSGFSELKTMGIDDSGNKWIGTILGGLLKYDDTSWEKYNPDNSNLETYSVIKLAFDSSGYVWADMDAPGGGFGIARFDGKKWKVFNTSNSNLPGNEMLGFANRPSGDKWIITNNGIGKFSGGSWSKFNTNNSNLPANEAKSIEISHTGNAWVSFETNGIAKYNGNNWQVFDKSSSGLPSNKLTTLKVDDEGDVWIGTADTGLVKWDGNKWTLYNQSNSDLPSNKVSAITIDNSGDQWIGTKDTGIVKHDDGQWITFEGNSWVPHLDSSFKRVNDITIEKPGKMWIKTGRNLLKYACNNTVSTINPTKCNKYVVPSKQDTIYQSKTLKDTISNHAGCDSIITINLTIKNVDSSITKSGDQLTANASGATYQWLDCDNDFAEVSGATSQSFTPSADGNYAVEVTQNNCTDTSSCYQVETSGIAGNDEKASFEIYPNPAADQLTLVQKDNLKPQTFQLQTLTGKSIKTGQLSGTERLDVSKMSPGVYLLEVQGADVVRTKKVVVK